MEKRGILCCGISLGILLASLIAAPSVQAEGAGDLASGGGYRPYTEQYNDGVGQQKMSVMHVYLKAGETVCFGTSVSDAQLYSSNDGKPADWLFSNSAMGTGYTDAQLAYVNTADIYVTEGNYANIADAIGAGMTPGKHGVTLIDLPSDAGSTTPGYIYDRAQEAGGADITGSGTGYQTSDRNTISSQAAGYIAGAKTDANKITVESDGIYTAVFFSSSHMAEDPLMKQIDDTAPFSETQGSGTIAAWDISVYHGTTLETGRVFTSELNLNMGGNALDESGVSTGSLHAGMYAVTDDGYQYLVDLNGLDASELTLYASRRGLLSLDSSGGSSSLLHSVRSESSTFSDLEDHGISLNQVPYTDLDENYSLFFEKPSSEALKALNIDAPKAITADGISDFRFTGTGSTAANSGYAGQGGTFSFTSANDTAGSYQIELDFSSSDGGRVVLSNALTSGVNSIAWDGKDANGSPVPAGTYSAVSLKLKSGEVHIPLLDAEQNPDGIRIIRQNGSGTDAEKAAVYYNNSAANAGDASSPWTAASWTVGDGMDETAGTDSASGAMAFTDAGTAGTSLLGDGDRAALDVWTYGSSVEIPLNSYSFSLMDTCFTAAAAWNNDAGTPAGGNPASVTMTLAYSDGTAVTADALGRAITNPAVLDASNHFSATWQNLDASRTYMASETPVAGYTLSSSKITGSAAEGYAVTVTNTYAPTSLKLSCTWDTNGNTGAALPASASFSVYRDAAKTSLYGTYTLDSASGWTKTIEGLDPALSYYVYESEVSGYASSPGGKACGNGADGFTSSFVNTLNDGGNAIVQAFVQWDNGSAGPAFQPKSVEVTLLLNGVTATADAKGNPVTNPVTLSDANGWYYAWSGLPGESAGDYSVAEAYQKGLPGYAISTDPENPPLVLRKLNSTIFNNSRIPTSFTVNQIWADGTGAAQPDSVTVQLRQSTDHGATYADYGDAVTLKKSEGWTYQWTDLPSYAADGTAIQYQAVENAPAGYAVTPGESAGTAESGYTETISGSSLYTSITVSDASTGIRPVSDWITLRKNGSAYDACTLSAAGGWTYTFANLPIRDSEGNPIVYTVSQSAAAGFITSGGSLEGSAAEGYTAAFVNVYQTTGFTASVSFANGVNATPPDSVMVQLRQSTDGINFTDCGQPVKLSSADSWSHAWTDLPIYSHSGSARMMYQAAETAPEGYTAAAGAVSGTADEGFSQAIANTYAYTRITVSDTSIGFRLSSISITLNQNGSPYQTCTLDAANSWTHEFSKLPITDADGNAIVYTVTAGSAASAGKLIGSPESGYTVALENAAAPAESSSKNPILWCITYLDCNGNTVSVQWIRTGEAPLKPAGFSYPDVSNVTSHQDVRPASCMVTARNIVPNTADRK